MWSLASRSTRFSVARYTIYLVGRTMRDISQGHQAVPHLLHPYIAASCLWSFYCAADGLQWNAIIIFCVGQYLRGRHYGA